MKTVAFLVLCLAGTIAIAADVRSTSSEAKFIVAPSGVQPKPRQLAPGGEIQVTISITTAGGAKSVHSATFAIASDGKAEVPEVGSVQAAGRTLPELSRDIERRFSERRGNGARPTVVIISKSDMGSLSLQNARAAGRIKGPVDSRPELLDAPGPQVNERR